MYIKCITVGHIEANCYIVTDDRTLECAVIDPGDETNAIMDYIEENRLVPRAILLTHGHYDHTGAAENVSIETGAPIWMSRADYTDKQGEQYRYFAPEGTRFFMDGDIIEVGSLSFRVLETPGHSPGSVTFMCEDALFTGDTLFRGSCGRVDLDGGDMAKMLMSLKRLYNLVGDYEVYPGHGGASTLNVERASNYYMRYVHEASS